MSSSSSTVSPGPEPTASPKGSWLEGIRRSLLVRLRSGQPRVLWPGQGLRFGNLLYLWMQAHMEQRKGEPTRVLDVEAGHGWRDEFPEIFTELTIPKKHVRFRDQRVLGTFQAFDYHFRASDLNAFCNAYLLPARGIQRFRASAEERGLLGAQSITINVRRGDYYSVAEYKERYGFDIRGYVRESLRKQLDRAPAQQVFFVSDDVPWCLERLGPVLTELGLEVSSAQEPNGARDFAHLAWSDRLILANSTFSYWGGYAATVRNPGSFVVAPWFHARDWLDGRAFQLHPAWVPIEGFWDTYDSE